MSFIHHIRNLTRTLIDEIAVKHVPIVVLALLAFNAHALTASQVFEKVNVSVVIVKSLDANGKTIMLGSGVILPTGKIGTNCHVVQSGSTFRVGGGLQFVTATLWGSDEDKDVCLLEAAGLAGEAAQLGKARNLKVGETVYAVGAPKGLELSLSDGIVSQLRGGPSPLIQTTAAISSGSSGGGLFDTEGRLVGFTTLYIDGGQSLNFAMPVEWAGEIQAGKKAVQGRNNMTPTGRSWADWEKRAIALETTKNWAGMRDWCQDWTREQPGNIFGWMHLSKALRHLKLYTEAIEIARQALKINPEADAAWIGLGDSYLEFKRYTEAIDAYRQAIRIDPELITAWMSLGDAYSATMRYLEAIEAYQQTVRIDPSDADLWGILATTYAESGNRTAALEALSQARRRDPVKANKWGKFVEQNRNAVAGWVIVGSDKTDATYANPSTIRGNGAMVRMWDLVDFKKAQLGQKLVKPYKSIRGQSEYDCEGERIRFLGGSLHSENMGRGNVVFSDDETGKWIAVPPDSRGRRLWSVACGKP